MLHNLIFTKFGAPQATSSALPEWAEGATHLKYEEIVPWGRSFEEYRRMFALSDPDLEKRIVGCADGPAGFNAEMTGRGGQVVSCDPLYRFTTQQIERRVNETYETVLRQTRQNSDKFVWKEIQSPEHLGRLRMEAMRQFLSDYDRGRNEGRYLAAELPQLPFEGGSFDLALCSHFLFLYSEHLSLSFHIRAVDEMCRVAKEVRIFPLLTYDSKPSPYAAPVVEHLRVCGHDVSVETVPYEFQRGGDKLLRVKVVGR